MGFTELKQSFESESVSEVETRIATDDESRAVSSGTRSWLILPVYRPDRSSGLASKNPPTDLTKSTSSPLSAGPFVSATQSAPPARPVAKNKCISTLICVPRAQSLIFAPAHHPSRARAPQARSPGSLLTQQEPEGGPDVQCLCAYPSICIQS